MANDHHAQKEASAKAAQLDKSTYLRSLQACHEAKTIAQRASERIKEARLDRETAVGALHVDTDVLPKGAPAPYISTYKERGGGRQH